MHHLGIPLPHENGFSKVKNAYIKSTYYSIFDNYCTNSNEIWMAGDWFYMTEYADFGSGGKTTSTSS